MQNIVKTIKSLGFCHQPDTPATPAWVSQQGWELLDLSLTSYRYGEPNTAVSLYTQGVIIVVYVLLENRISATSILHPPKLKNLWFQ